MLRVRFPLVPGWEGGTVLCWARRRCGLLSSSAYTRSCNSMGCVPSEPGGDFNGRFAVLVGRRWDMGPTMGVPEVEGVEWDETRARPASMGRCSPRSC